MHRSEPKFDGNRLLMKTKARYRHVRLPRTESETDVFLSTDEEILGESIQNNQASVLSWYILSHSIFSVYVKGEQGNMIVIRKVVGRCM